MLSTNIETRFNGTSHTLPVSIKDSIIKMKFDTGASHTVISSELIFGEMTTEKKEKIIRALESKGCRSTEFISASGHKFMAYPIYAKDVIVDNDLFKNFYYNLIIDPLENGRRLALLGEDFIECCTYFHKIHHNICISEFDDNFYMEQRKDFVCDEVFPL